jgi:LmbE family N-acetylglucosaminyl deacetylase
MAQQYRVDRGALAARRHEEAIRAVQLFGGAYECLGVHDGDVYVTPELTERLVRVIRSWGPPGVGPDLVLTNRPNDYHRDHRYTAQAVLDTSYLLTVPLMCPDTPHLARMPVFAYWFDGFAEGGAFRPDVVVPVDGELEVLTWIGLAHASQSLEWLPYNAGVLDQVPTDDAGRAEFVRSRMEARKCRVAEGCRRAGAGIVPEGCELAEAFQVSEYGRRPAPEELALLFPLDPP